MNQLHAAFVKQQQQGPCKHAICPHCGLPALFVTQHAQRETFDDRYLQDVTGAAYTSAAPVPYLCPNCQRLVLFAEPWPIGLIPRAAAERILVSTAAAAIMFG